MSDERPCIVIVSPDPRDAAELTRAVAGQARVVGSPSLQDLPPARFVLLRLPDDPEARQAVLDTARRALDRAVPLIALDAGDVAPGCLLDAGFNSVVPLPQPPEGWDRLVNYWLAVNEAL